MNFSKGLVDDFGRKLGIFALFVFEKISLEIYFIDMLDGKKGFLGYKYVFEKSEIIESFQRG